MAKTTKGGKKNPRKKAASPKSQTPPIANRSKSDIDEAPSLPVPAEEPRKGGRPTVYTEAIGKRLCELLGTGKTLTSICKDDSLPPAPSVIRWAIDPDHPFSEQYARARMVGYTIMADEFVDIGDDVGENPGAVAKARLRAESRKWLLSKALPKVYGDKLALTDADGGTFKVQFVE